MTTHVQDSCAAPTPILKTGARRPLLRGIIAVAAVATFVAGMGATASAAPGDTSGDTTVATIGVTSSITLSGLTPGFRLNGLPGATVTGAADVSYTVETNNIAGYSVTVLSESATLDPTTVGNPDNIPIGNLGVRATAAGNTGAFTAVGLAAVTVHDQGARSAPGGDSFTNDYQIAIPFVAEDLYTATLDYTATASL